MTALLKGLGYFRRKIKSAIMKGNRIRKFTTLKIGIDKVLLTFHFSLMKSLMSFS